MKSNFYGNRKSLLAVFICAAFLSGSHVAYAVNESLLVSAYQQPSKIKGTVIDANGEVVIGASVVVKGTANGTITTSPFASITVPLILLGCWYAETNNDSFTA